MIFRASILYGSKLLISIVRTLLNLYAAILSVALEIKEHLKIVDDLCVKLLLDMNLCSDRTLLYRRLQYMILNLAASSCHIAFMSTYIHPHIMLNPVN